MSKREQSDNRILGSLGILRRVAGETEDNANDPETAALSTTAKLSVSAVVVMIIAGAAYTTINTL